MDMLLLPRRITVVCALYAIDNHVPEFLHIYASGNRDPASVSSSLSDRSS